jgi:nucleotide-binding universal stress UspA family protein
MIRRILIPLDPSPYSDAVLEYTIYVAKQHDAQVCALAVLDIPGIRKSIGPMPVGGIHYAEELEEFKEQEAHKHIQALLKNFKEKCQKARIRHCEVEEQGSPSKRIIHDSIFYDLVIMGFCTYYHFETRNKPSHCIDKILDHTISPVLAVPNFFKPINKVLIAFDGSLPAACALQRFAHLAYPYQLEITLLMSSNNIEVANYYLDQAEAYLRAYSFNLVKKEWIPENIIQAMKEKYLVWADLVVAGIHSKKRLIDFRVGSLSRYLIKEAKKPLLLGQ